MPRVCIHEWIRLRTEWYSRHAVATSAGLWMICSEENVESMLFSDLKAHYHIRGYTRNVQRFAQIRERHGMVKMTVLSKNILHI